MLRPPKWLFQLLSDRGACPWLGVGMCSHIIFNSYILIFFISDFFLYQEILTCLLQPRPESRYSLLYGKFNRNQNSPRCKMMLSFSLIRYHQQLFSYIWFCILAQSLPIILLILNLCFFWIWLLTLNVVGSYSEEWGVRAGRELDTLGKVRIQVKEEACIK